MIFDRVIGVNCEFICVLFFLFLFSSLPLRLSPIARKVYQIKIMFELRAFPPKICLLRLIGVIDTRKRRNQHKHTSNLYDFRSLFSLLFLFLPFFLVFCFPFSDSLFQLTILEQHRQIDLRKRYEIDKNRKIPIICLSFFISLLHIPI